MMDLTHNLKVAVAKIAAQVTATGSTSVTVDTQFYEMVMFIIAITLVAAADASNYLTFSVKESDDSTFGDGTEAVVATDRIIGTMAVINLTTQANSVMKFGIKPGTKRYLKLYYTETGTFDATFGATAVLGGARHNPVA